MEESIYNLIPREHQAAAKQLKYTSKFKSNVKTETTHNKAPHKTMGPAKVTTNNPNEFLRKHEKEPKLPENQRSGQGSANRKEKSFKYQEERRKPPVPDRNDRPVMGLLTTKNFIKQNAIETIMAVPKQPEKVYVDTRAGDKHNLIPSGMEPVYVHKKSYGETPAYLKQRQMEMMKAQQDYEAYLQMSMQKGAMQSLSDEERAAIIRGLKMNWEQLHQEFQGLSVITDTAPKKNRKERLESEMKQLERDIELIERHRYIYIAG